MKRISAKNISEILPAFAAYVTVGLLVLHLAQLTAYNTLFLLWGVAGALIIYVNGLFGRRLITVLMALGMTGLLVWMCFYYGRYGGIHVILSLTGIVGIAFLRILLRDNLPRIIWGALMVVTLVVLTILDKEVPRVIVALGCFWVLVGISALVGFKNNSNSQSLLPIYAVVAVLTLFTPVSEEPYDWNFVVKFVEGVENLVERISFELYYLWGDVDGDGSYHFSFTGFSDGQSSIRGSGEERELEQLIIQGRRTKGNTYLKGSVSNVFNGDGWENTIKNTDVEWDTDTLITLYALISQVEEYKDLKLIMEVGQHEIFINDIKTRSYFYPAKPLTINGKSMIYAGDHFKNTNVWDRQSKFTITYVNIDYSSQQVTDILKNAHRIEYDKNKYYEMEAVMNDYFVVDLDLPSYDSFLAQVKKAGEQAKKDYGTVGTHLSDRGKELAKELVKNCTNDFDKCKAIESYLHTYTYDKTVSIPEGVNVIDWFLFEEKKGFCIHYATCMVEMLRSVGVEARMAEGFLVDYGSQNMLNNYSVHANNAHAWVEAYIDGFGWVRLEPTSSNAADAYKSWWQEWGGSVGEGFEEEDETLTEEEKEQEQLEQEARKVKDIIVYLVAGLAAMGLLFAIIIFISRKIAIRRSRDIDVLFANLLALMEKRYAHKDDWMTLREYFLEIENNVDDITAEKLDSLLTIMEQHWYTSVKANNNPAAVQLIKDLTRDIRQKK